MDQKNNIVIKKSYKSTEGLYGVSPHIFKGMPIEKVHELKIAICDIHLKYLMEIPIEKRDYWQISDLIKAKKWNQDTLKDLG